MRYYLHRISHKLKWSDPLLKERNLLSIGWADFAASEYWPPDSQDLSRIPENVEGYYEGEGWDIPRTRFGLQRFLQMKQGDRVVVPTWGAFHVYEVTDNKCLVAPDIEKELQSLKSLSGKCAFIEDDYLKEANGEENTTTTVDLGFFRRVEEVQREIPRAGYADAALTSRMKVRQANVEITDLSNNIEEAINAFKAKRPINLREIVLKECAKSVRKTILEKLTPGKFERLIKLFFEHQGADAIIPPKNEKDKQGDADVIATFELLKFIVYVQAKHHDGETDDWAVEQIESYRDNKIGAMTGDEYSRTAWVISTAESFSEDCENLAKRENVRLIDGIKFAELLLDAGIERLDHLMGA